MIASPKQGRSGIIRSCKLHKNTIRIANKYLIGLVQTLRRKSVLLEFFTHSIRLIPFYRHTAVIHANRVHAVGTPIPSRKVVPALWPSNDCPKSDS